MKLKTTQIDFGALLRKSQKLCMKKDRNILIDLHMAFLRVAFISLAVNVVRYLLFEDGV